MTALRCYTKKSKSFKMSMVLGYTAEEKIVDDFEKDWKSTGTWYFACHAAFPVILTPDLLHKLRINFYVDEKNKPFNLPITAVSDILHAPFVNEIGSGMWEMMPGVRTILLKKLRDSEKLGMPRLKKLARFLWVYLQECPLKIPSKAFSEAQKWYSKCYISPEHASVQLIHQIIRPAPGKVAKKMQQGQFMRLAGEYLELTGEQDSNMSKAVSVSWLHVKNGLQGGQARSIEDILESVPQLKNYIKRKDQPSDEAISFPLPQSVWEKISEKKEGGEASFLTEYYGKIHLFYNATVPADYLESIPGYQSNDGNGPALLNFRTGTIEARAEDNSPIHYRTFEFRPELPAELDHLLFTKQGHYFIVIQLDPADRTFKPKYQQQLMDWTRRVSAVLGYVTVKVLLLSRQTVDISLKEVGQKYWCHIAEVIVLSQNSNAWMASLQSLEEMLLEQTIFEFPLVQIGVWRNLTGNEYYTTNDLQKFKESFDFSQPALTSFLSKLQLAGELLSFWRFAKNFQLASYEEEEIMAAKTGLLTRFIFSVFALAAANKGMVPKSDLPPSLADDRLLGLAEKQNLLFEQRQKVQSQVIVPSRIEARKLSALPLPPSHKSSHHYAFLFEQPLPAMLLPRVTAAVGNQKQNISDLSFSRHQHQFSFDEAKVEILERSEQRSIAFRVESHASGLYRDKVASLIKTEASWFESLEKHQSLQFELVRVTGGTFAMGHNRYDEHPVRNVTLNSFMIGKFPVTINEINRYANHLGVKELKRRLESLHNRHQKTDPDANFGNHPMVYFSWIDAVRYCNWLSEIWGFKKVYRIEGGGTTPSVQADWSANGFRLPTEAEWEYAARGGQESRRYRFAGSDEISKVAVYKQKTTSEVGTKSPNELGVFDMSGNVQEWCWDNYAQRYDGEDTDNPKGGKQRSGKVARGGYYSKDASDCQVTKRQHYLMENKNPTIGFRIVRSI